MPGPRCDVARIGEAFQRLTRDPVGGGEARRGLRQIVAPERRVTGMAEPVRLPLPQVSGGIPLWEAIRARASRRFYRVQAIALSALSQLLWAGQGLRGTPEGPPYRTTPSGGRRYPVETYLSVHAVEGVEPGLYYHDVGPHALVPIRFGDFRAETATAMHGQKVCANAAVVLIWTAVVERSTPVLGQRAYRYFYIEAGHIAQNVALSAVALGLGSCQIGGFCDDALSDMLGLDREGEPPVYATAVGMPK